MISGTCLQEGSDQWLFTKEALVQIRETNRERVLQVLTARSSTASRRASVASGDVRPLALEEGLRLVLFYALKLPELCQLCNAPFEVQWTAIVFFRRFFARASPMEFDPLPMMFASVHVACKIEELKEITLDRLLEAGGFGDDKSMKTKVSDLELELLEGIGFQLLIEPKPDSSLRMLYEELRTFASKQNAQFQFPEDLLKSAETLVLNASVRSDALLHSPPSLLIAAAFALAAERGQNSPDAMPSGSISALVLSFLQSHLEDDDSRTALEDMFKAARRHLEVNFEDLEREAMQEIARAARRCHRIFERLRDERKENHEANHKERKRRRNEMKAGIARRQVPTPMKDLSDLKRKAKALQSVDSFSTLPNGNDEDFVIHDLPDDMEDD